MKRISIRSYLMLNVDKTCIYSLGIYIVVKSKPRFDGEKVVSVFKIKILNI